MGADSAPPGFVGFDELCELAGVTTTTMRGRIYRAARVRRDLIEGRRARVGYKCWYDPALAVTLASFEAQKPDVPEGWISTDDLAKRIAESTDGNVRITPTNLRTRIVRLMRSAPELVAQRTILIGGCRWCDPELAELAELIIPPGTEKARLKDARYADLPTSLEDSRLGVEDVELCQLVAVALSYHLAEKDGYRASKPGRGNKMAVLAKVLMECAETSLERGGVLYPAARPDGIKPRFTLVADARVSKHLGLDYPDIDELWAKARSRMGKHNAHLPIDLLCSYYPPELWPAAAAIIHDGPGIATERVEAVLLRGLEHEVPPNRKRTTGGRRSDAWFEHRAAAATRFFKQLVQLRHHTLSHKLELWVGVPKISVPRGAGKTWSPSISAPSLHLLRWGWDQLDRAVESKLGVPLDRQVDAVRMISDHQIKQRTAGLTRLLRNRAAFATYLILAGRTGAIQRARRRDLVANHRGLGPAIALYPEKTWGHGEVSYKFVPVEFLHVLKTYMAYIDRFYPRGLPDTTPLIVTGPESLRPWAGFTNWIGGTLEAPAFLPKDPTQPHVGYTSHNFRYAASQIVRLPQTRQLFLERQVGIDADWLAANLLDHGTGLEQLYGGAGQTQDRERNIGQAIQAIWDMLTSDAGAYKDRTVADRWRGLRRTSGARRRRATGGGASTTGDHCSVRQFASLAHTGTPRASLRATPRSFPAERHRGHSQYDRIASLPRNA